MIHRLAEARLPLPGLDSAASSSAAATSSTSAPSASAPSADAVKRSWMKVIDELLHHGDPAVAGLAIEALPHFCSAFFDPRSPTFEEERTTLVDLYRDVVVGAAQEKSRQGHCLALAALPRFMYGGGHLAPVVDTLKVAASLSAASATTTEW